MGRNLKLLLVVIGLLLFELCYYTYHGSDSNHLIGQQSPPSAPNAPEDRIKKEIEGEISAIYGEETPKESPENQRIDSTDDGSRIDLKERFQRRNEHLAQVCDKYELSSHKSQRRTNEFMINNQYGLIWCTVFKAASSSWLWNFNLLAGYTEKQLLAKISDPLGMARKKYPRPSATKIDAAMKGNPSTITLMVVRHPFTRLISGFRDKILDGKRYYRPLAERMMKAHPELANQHAADWIDYLPQKKMTMPTFAQFVQYIVDERNNRKVLNEHWIPMNDYCTPCRNDINHIAKVESLGEDGNYIIYKAGIQDIIKPKVLNQASGDRSDALNEYFMCQLTKGQLNALINLYKYDLELFDYDVQKYVDCAKDSKDEVATVTRKYEG